MVIDSDTFMTEVQKISGDLIAHNETNCSLSSATLCLFQQGNTDKEGVSVTVVLSRKAELEIVIMPYQYTILRDGCYDWRFCAIAKAKIIGGSLM